MNSQRRKGSSSGEIAKFLSLAEYHSFPSLRAALRVTTMEVDTLAAVPRRAWRRRAGIARAGRPQSSRAPAPFSLASILCQKRTFPRPEKPAARTQRAQLGIYRQLAAEMGALVVGPVQDGALLRTHGAALHFEEGVGEPQKESDMNRRARAHSR